MLFLLLRYGAGPVGELADASCLVLGSCLSIATEDFGQAAAAGVLSLRDLFYIHRLVLNWFGSVYSHVSFAICTISTISSSYTTFMLHPQTIISDDLIDLLYFVGFVHLSRSVTQGRHLELLSFKVLLDKHVALSLLLPLFRSYAGLGLVLLREDLLLHMQLILDFVELLGR